MKILYIYKYYYKSTGFNIIDCCNKDNLNYKISKQYHITVKQYYHIELFKNRFIDFNSNINTGVYNGIFNNI